MGWGWVFSFLLVRQALIFLQWARLWLPSFSRMQALSGRTECSSHSLTPLCWKPRRIFLWNLWIEILDVNHIYVVETYSWVLTFRVFHTVLSVICLLQFRFLWLWFPWWVSQLSVWQAVTPSTCLSTGSVLMIVSSVLCRILQKLAFQPVQLFVLWKSGDFYAPYT